jgi:hypothetical protein
MKNLFPFIIFIILFISCNSDDDNGCTGIDCLPPITKTGAGTFGCLVNGEPFVDNSGNFNCFYQLVDGEYYFGMRAMANTSITNFIALRADILQLSEGNYNINTLNDGNFSMLMGYGSGNNYEIITSQDMSGTLTISNFDLTSQIISFEFEVNIITPDNQTINVTSGRFDSFFTR